MIGNHELIEDLEEFESIVKITPLNNWWIEGVVGDIDSDGDAECKYYYITIDVTDCVDEWSPHSDEFNILSYCHYTHSHFYDEEIEDEGRMDIIWTNGAGHGYETGQEYLQVKEIELIETRSRRE